VPILFGTVLAPPVGQASACHALSSPVLSSPVLPVPLTRIGRRRQKSPSRCIFSVDDLRSCRPQKVENADARRASADRLLTGDFKQIHGMRLQLQLPFCAQVVHPRWRARRWRSRPSPKTCSELRSVGLQPVQRPARPTRGSSAGRQRRKLCRPEAGSAARGRLLPPATNAGERQMRGPTEKADRLKPVLLSRGRTGLEQASACHGLGARRRISRSTLSLSLPRIGQAAMRRTVTFFTKPLCRASPFSSSHRGPLMTSSRP